MTMQTEVTGVTRHNAGVIARDVSARLDQPAWILQDPREGYHTTFHVMCMSYQELDEHWNTGNVVAVVLPNGREFQRLATSWGRE